jgi:hypothetical protein
MMVLVTESQELPGSVAAAYERAARAGFRLACEAGVGRLLAALAAAVLSGGRVLEIGTGVGAGLAWLVHGLGARRDVEVVTVELDDQVQRTALSAPWPPWVRFESGYGAEAVGRLGQFDLIFRTRPAERSSSYAGRWPRFAGAASWSLTTWTSPATTISSFGLPRPLCVTVSWIMLNSSVPNWASAAASSWPSSTGRDLRGGAPIARYGT